MLSTLLDINILPICTAVYKKEKDDFIFVDFNKKAEEVEKIKKDDLLGRKFTDIYPSMKKFGLYDVFLRVEETGISETHETAFYVDERISGYRKNEVVKLENGNIATFFTDKDEEKKLNFHKNKLEKKLDKATSLLEHQRKMFQHIMENTEEISVQGYNEQHEVIYWNKASEKLYGYKQDEVLGKKLENIIIPEFMQEAVHAGIEAWIEEGVAIPSGELTLRDKFGNDVNVFSEHIMIEISPQQKEMYCLDISLKEMKRREAQLEFLANYDSLTGLANRFLLKERLTQLTKKRKKDNEYSAILFMDLDHFKEINDSMGHTIGDEVLLTMAERLKKIVRAEDTLSRLGGDEFMILLENINSPLEAGNVAQKVLKSIQEPIVIKENQFFLTASIGIVVYPDDSDDVEKLISFADSAMYKAKENGRNNFEYYTEELSQIAMDRILLENNLRRAIENKEFVLYYQPQVNAMSKKLLGIEALIRWKHPDMGIISPDKFIPIAELSGLILPIGRWVMQQAMEDMVTCQKNGLDIDYVSINLSVKQLVDNTLIQSIKDALKTSGCNPKCVEFEITESYAMRNPKEVKNLLEKITKLGCSISIDDFGTGYSSLSYLKSLPIEKLKIDQSFIEDVPGSNDDESIVNAVILIAQSMELEVIAEGVETTEQQEFLLEHGCMLSQGYLYAKPMPLEEIKNYIV